MKFDVEGSNPFFRSAAGRTFGGQHLSRPRLMLAALALCASSIGCRGSTSGAPQPALSTSDQLDRPTSGAPSTRNAETETLLVGGLTGIRELTLDGAVLRVVSMTPAERPRLLPQGGVLFLASEGRELRLLEPDTGSERVVGTLPREFGCLEDRASSAGQGIALEELRVQADGDFVVDENGRAACLHLQDRNDNMMVHAVLVRVDLSNGRSTYATLLPAACPGQTPVEQCATRQEPVTPREDVSSRFPFGLEAGHLVRRAAHGSERVGPVLAPGDWQESAVSPSGRWVVIEGNLQEGDYIYRDLLLLDRQDGRLFSIAEGAVSAPLRTGELENLGTAAVRTVTVVGETTLRWHGAGDVLIVGSLLVVPGERGTELGGDVGY